MATLSEALEKWEEIQKVEGKLAQYNDLVEQKETAETALSEMMESLPDNDKKRLKKLLAGYTPTKTTRAATGGTGKKRQIRVDVVCKMIGKDGMTPKELEAKLEEERPDTPRDNLPSILEANTTTKSGKLMLNAEGKKKAGLSK